MVTEAERFEAQQNNYRTAYTQVCESYHKIDDFRAKLLGFLPVVSGVGALALVNSEGMPLEASREFLVFAGVFGALVTLGLFLYEVRGIRHCTFLIDRGRELERKLGLGAKGQFAHWDPDITLRPMKVADFPRAAQVIYPTVFAAWVWVASYGLSGLGSLGVPPLWIAIGAGVLALVAFVVAWKMTERASAPLCPCRTIGGTQRGSSGAPATRRREVSKRRRRSRLDARRTPAMASESTARLDDTAIRALTV